MGNATSSNPRSSVYSGNASSGGRNLANYSIGVSKSGIEKIQEDLKLFLVEKAGEILSGSTGEFEQVSAAIREMWQGEDSIKYLENLKRESIETQDTLNTTYQQIATTLNAVYESWESFQKSNVM